MNNKVYCGTEVQTSILYMSRMFLGRDGMGQFFLGASPGHQCCQVSLDDSESVARGTGNPGQTCPEGFHRTVSCVSFMSHFVPRKFTTAFTGLLGLRRRVQVAAKCVHLHCVQHVYLQNPFMSLLEFVPTANYAKTFSKLNSMGNSL